MAPAVLLDQLVQVPQVQVGLVARLACPSLAPLAQVVLPVQVAQWENQESELLDQVDHLDQLAQLELVLLDQVDLVGHQEQVLQGQRGRPGLADQLEYL